MKTFNIQRRNRSQRRGVALVEMALMLPLMLTTVMGIIEFGRAMMTSQLVTNAAREATRFAITNNGSNSEVKQMAKEFLAEALGVAEGDVSVTVEVDAAPGNPDPGNAVENAQTRDLCMVTVEVPFEKVQFIPGKFLGGKTLRGYSAMRHE